MRRPAPTSVTLTVTDDDGATNSITKPVTVTAPAPQDLARDDFSQPVTGGFGTADVGGNWTAELGPASPSPTASGS